MPWTSNSGSSGPGNPWGTPPGSSSNGGGPSPWSGGRPAEDRSAGSSKPTDFTEILRRRRGGNGGGGPGGSGDGPSNWVIGAGIAGVILAFVLVTECFFRVQPEEQGIVVTFGEYDQRPRPPGLHFKWPRPIQSVTRVPVERRQFTTIGTREGGRDSSQRGEQLMITADQNIVDVAFEVQWTIKDPGAYLFNINDPVNTLRNVAESVMREVIGRTKVTDALTKDRERIASDTRQGVQQLMDEYGAGIQIQQVNLTDIAPPETDDPQLNVVAAFSDVIKAVQDAQTVQNQAQAKANQIVPEAEAERQRLILEAEAYRESVVNRANGEANRFTALLDSYRLEPELTRQRLYLETMQEVFGRSRKVLLEGGGGALPLLPLSEALRPLSPQITPTGPVLNPPPATSPTPPLALPAPPSPILGAPAVRAN